MTKYEGLACYHRDLQGVAQSNVSGPRQARVPVHLQSFGNLHIYIRVNTAVQGCRRDIDRF